MAHSMRAVAQNNRDELYTPKILVEPIIKHLLYWTDYIFNPIFASNRKKPTILCPWDTDKSEFVIELKKRNEWNVKYGHISTGQDYFVHDYGDWDICVSNPPFSQKLKIMQSLIAQKKPFALICNAMSMNYQEIGGFFADNPIQILGFDKRVSFDGNPSSFMSIYYCHKFLKNDLIFEHLEHNNTGKYYVPSHMYT